RGDRERRVAFDSLEPRLLGPRPAVDRERVHDRVRGLSDAGWARERSVRPAAHVHRGPFAVRGSFARGRARGLAGDADRRARVAVPEHRREGARASFDLAGALSVTGGLLALVYGIVSAASHGWGSANALGPIAGGLALLALFAVLEGRVAKSPLVPLRVFSNRV